MIRKKIRLKLIIGFLVGVLSIGLFSLYSHHLFDTAKSSIDKQAGILESAQSVSLYTKESFYAMNLYMYIQNSTELEELRSRYVISAYNSGKHLADLINYSYELNLVSGLKAYSDERESILQEMIHIHDSILFEDDEQIVKDLKSQESILSDRLHELEDKVEDSLNIILDEAYSDFDNAIYQYDLIIQNTRILLLVIVIYSCGLAIYIADSLGKPISYLRDMAHEVGKGNLDVKIQVKTRDELSEVANEFNKMVRSLKRSEKLIRNKNKRLSNAYARLKELDKKKDEFISISSHELKTPLTSIKGFAQLMHKDSVMNDKKKLRHYLDLIDQNSQRLGKFIMDLVDFSRMSLGEFKLDIQKIDVYSLFDDINSNMVMVIKGKNLTPDFSIKKNLPQVIGDKERILQVVRNLLTNAVKFTDKGKISLAIYRKGKYVQFEVRDTGKGIPKEKQKFIFSKFYQVDGSYTRQFGGSGLGLSICKGLVELMGGRIWFESELDKGTVFYFTLPAA